MQKNFLLFLMILSLPVFSFAKNLPIYTEANTSVTADVNHPEFVIQLNSNPTTGYSWSLTSYDTNYIQMIAHQYIRTNTTRIGAGGVEKWSFRLTPDALTTQRQLTLRFTYTRPWETQKTAKIANFYISISKPLPLTQDQPY